MKKNISTVTKIALLALTLSLGASYAFAWTPPGATPPGGNVDAPLNTSVNNQTKTGGLLTLLNEWINGALGVTGGATFGGNVGVGTATPANPLTVVQTTAYPASGIQMTSSIADPNIAITNTSAAGRDWRIISAGTGSGVPSKLRVYDATAGLDRMVVDSAGNVGIGSTAPAYKFTIGTGNAAFGVENTATFLAKNSAGAYEAYLWPRWSDNATYLNYGVGGLNIRNNASALTMSMNNAGNVNATGSITSTGGFVGNLSGVASSANLVNGPDGDRNANTKLPTSNPQAVRFDFVGAASTGTGGNYAGLMTYAPWTGTTASTGDASYQLAFGSTAVNATGVPKLRVRNGIDSTWNGWKNIITDDGAGNITATSFTGSLNGNATTATNLQPGGTAGQVLTSNGAVAPTWQAPAGLSGGVANYMTKWLTPTSIGNSIVFDNGTNVGIGTATPATTLDVSGIAKATGLQLPTGAAAGKMLTSDAVGFATWTTPLSGSGVATYIPKWSGTSTLTNSQISDNGSVVSMSNLNVVGTLSAWRVNPQNIENKLAQVDTNGAWTWTNVITKTFAPAPGNQNSGMLAVQLDASRPVLGMRIAMSSDDGGICIAGVPGYFMGGATHIAYISDLDLNSVWYGWAWNNGAGVGATGTWIFEGLAPGRNLGAQTYANNTAYNKALGMTYIPAGNWLYYVQWYNDGQGGYYNTCTIDVLYGNY